MKTKNIKQEVRFKVGPHEVYEALMDSKKHAALTGQSAMVSRRVGGAFSAYDGYITGKNLVLVPDKKIVQSWQASDWPEGCVSKATFLLKPVRGGTALTFTQTGVPADQYTSIKQGWIDYYWKPMKKLLEK